MLTYADVCCRLAYPMMTRVEDTVTHPAETPPPVTLPPPVFQGPVFSREPGLGNKYWYMRPKLNLCTGMSAELNVFAERAPLFIPARVEV
jgi:hypothetical protein